MFDMMFFYVALVGSSLAGLIDLKTTEIPDKIPYAMIAFGIIGYLIKSIIIGSYFPILFSIMTGLIFLGFGLLMYFGGQWGGGDAKILSAIGFLLPYSIFQTKTLFSFPLSYFFNVFLIGAAYMIVYIFILSFIKREIWKEFFKYFKQNSLKLIKLNLIFALSIMIFSSFAAYFYAYPFYFFIKLGGFLMIGTFLFFLFWKFAKTVETVGFKKKIPVSKLKEGDVLESSKIWEGITKEQLRKIKKSKKKYVTIKDGVRFAPAFPLALLFTFYYGDAIFWILNYFIF